MLTRKAKPFGMPISWEVQLFENLYRLSIRSGVRLISSQSEMGVISEMILRNSQCLWKQRVYMIVGTVLGGLATAMAGGNGLLGLSGSGRIAPSSEANANDSNTYVTKAEMKMIQDLAAKDSEIALLKSEQNTEVKIADVYERIMTRVNSDQREQAAWNAQQSVNNATMSAAIATNAASIANLQNCCNQITKLVVPNTSVCPGWGTVQITPTTTTTTTA